MAETHEETVKSLDAIILFIRQRASLQECQIISKILDERMNAFTIPPELLPLYREIGKLPGETTKRLLPILMGIVNLIKLR